MGSQRRPDIGEFIKTLRRGRGRFVPIAELGIHPLIKQRLLGRPITGLPDEIEFWHRAGYDYVKLQPGADFNPARVPEETRLVTSPDGTAPRKWAAEGSGVITSWREFEAYRFPTESEFTYRTFESVRDLLPEGLGVIGQYGDIFTMTWELMGFQTFSTSLYEEPALVEALNSRLGTLVLSMFEYFAQSDAVDVLWYSDDIAYASGLIVSPQVLRRLLFPWLRKIGTLARRAGKPLIYHTDGALEDVLEEIIDCGVDAIHPIEPKAMDLERLKHRYGDRLCLMGHVDVDLLSRGEPHEVRAQVRRNIEVAAYNGGYCVGSGNSIPDYVRYENYIAMLDAAREYGE